MASGYVDRASEREAAEKDNREERLKALEESYKKKEIDEETFEKLRFDIAGGDLASTHLVKGLDFKLLQRVRQGENVWEPKDKDQEDKEAEEKEPEVDIDDEFDNFEQQKIEAPTKEKSTEKKKGQLSTVPLAPGKKRTRDQILAELKASRAAAKAKQEPALGDRFRKIGAKQEAGSRIEIDSRGREVLIIVDEDGHEKRKVRKVQDAQDDEAKRDLLMPAEGAKPLGMEVPEQYRKQEEPEDDSDIDIFDDIGDDYDPLAGVEVSDSDDSDSDGDHKSKKKRDHEPAQERKGSEESDVGGHDGMPPPSKPPSAPRNYFKDSKTGLASEETIKAPSMSDPAIMAAIKRAAALNPISKEEDEGDDGQSLQEKREREERRKRMLEGSRRDDEDLDMGFGTSRFEDEEDFDDQKVKLSAWGGDDDEGQGSGKAKRKRGPKKRKGDANNVNDVLRVMEQRKK